MKLQIKEALTEKQFKEISEVYKACRDYEPISLSGPSTDDPGALYVLAIVNRRIVGFLEIFNYEEYLDVKGFVEPKHRNKGIFSSMTEILESEYDYPLHFISDDISEGAKHLSSSKNFSCLATEYLLIQDISIITNTPVALKKSSSNEFFSMLQCIFYPELSVAETKKIYNLEHDEASTSYLLMYQSKPIGTVILNINGGCAYISSYGIAPDLRKNGLGIKGILAVLNASLASRCTRAMVQVSDSNLPAMGLYEKAGFRIFSKLSIYKKGGA